MKLVQWSMVVFISMLFLSLTRFRLNHFSMQCWVMQRFLAINSLSSPLMCGSILNLLFISDNWYSVNRLRTFLLCGVLLSPLSDNWLEHSVGTLNHNASVKCLQVMNGECTYKWNKSWLIQIIRFWWLIMS